MEKLEKFLYDKKTGMEYQLSAREVYLPLFYMGELDHKTLGKYGRMYLKYLQNNREGYYNHLLLSGQLYNHLVEVECRAKTMIEEIIMKLSSDEKSDEVLKKEEPLKWNGLMLNYLKCAEEIVLKEVIYT